MDCTNLQPRLRHVDVGNPPSRTTQWEQPSRVSVTKDGLMLFGERRVRSFRALH
jgi:hypothetical protein